MNPHGVGGVKPLHARRRHFPDTNLAVENDVTLIAPQTPVGVVMIGVADGCRTPFARCRVHDIEAMIDAGAAP